MHGVSQAIDCPLRLSQRLVEATAVSGPSAVTCNRPFGMDFLGSHDPAPGWWRIFDPGSLPTFWVAIQSGLQQVYRKLPYSMYPPLFQRIRSAFKYIFIHELSITCCLPEGCVSMVGL